MIEQYYEIFEQINVLLQIANKEGTDALTSLDLPADSLQYVVKVC